MSNVQKRIDRYFVCHYCLEVFQANWFNMETKEGFKRFCSARCMRNFALEVSKEHNGN